jgi:hypothetical protein
MNVVAELLALAAYERDSLLPFFDPYAQLGSAYDDLRQMERGAEFQELWNLSSRLPEAASRSDQLQELGAARAWLRHMAQAFASERAAGKWPEVLKPEAQSAIERLNGAIQALQ